MTWLSSYTAKLGCTQGFRIGVLGLGFAGCVQGCEPGCAQSFGLRVWSWVQGFLTPITYLFADSCKKIITTLKIDGFATLGFRVQPPQNDNRYDLAF